MHFNHLNPSIEPFYQNVQVATSLLPWPALPDGQPRRISVNSFGKNSFFVLTILLIILRRLRWYQCSCNIGKLRNFDRRRAVFACCHNSRNRHYVVEMFYSALCLLRRNRVLSSSNAGSILQVLEATSIYKLTCIVLHPIYKEISSLFPSKLFSLIQLKSMYCH